MYKQIKQTFIKPFDDWLIFKGDLRYSYDSFGVTISYYEISNIDLFKSLHYNENLLPVKPDWIEMGIVTGTGKLYPHRDHGTTVSLNYYVKAANIDTTSFYYPKIGSEPEKYPGKKTSNIYSYDSIEMPPYDSFVAESGGAYVFQTSSIHDVDKKSTEERVIICYQWSSKNYFQVLKGLKDGQY